MDRPALPVSVVRAHREKLSDPLAAGGAVALIPSGLPVPISGTDQYHPFHTHPEHYWLTGLPGPGNVLICCSQP